MNMKNDFINTKTDFIQIQIERLQELISKVNKRIEKLNKTKQLHQIRLVNKKKELEKASKLGK